MSKKITDERIKSIARKLGVFNEGIAIDELLDTLMDKIEELAKESGSKWKNDNAETINFYNDVVEEMEKMLEYESTFF